MSTLSDRLGQVTVTARSSTGAVEAVIGPRQGLRVRSGPAGIGNRTERSLAADIEAAVAAAMRGTREAVHRIRTEHRGGREPVVDPVAARRRDTAKAALAVVTVTATSPSGLVVVTRTGTDDVTVRLCRGSLRRLTDERLMTEVNAALADTARQLGDIARSIHRESYSAAAARRDREQRPDRATAR